jgi:hypothetical protein
MRLSELLTEDTSDDLVALKQQRDALLRQWDQIKLTEPKGTDTGKGYSIARPDESAWWSDPERGGFWPQRIYPVNQEIERLETLIKKQHRVAILKTKGSDDGFDTSEILYHGTDADFETFDRTKARTAAHIYTSPDLETSEGYGDHVYAVYGRQQPQAVLTAEDCDYTLLRRIHRRGFKKAHGLSYKEFVDLVTDAGLYGSNGSLQDDVASTCFDMGYRSVRITDGKPGGGYSDSVIFNDPTNLQIVEQVS